jgi:hypothetical protein
MLHARSDYQRFQDPEGRIGEDEPVMLFRAQDRHFVPVLRAYLEFLEQDQDAKPEIKNAVYMHIMAALRWQDRNPTKTPDLP